MEYREAIEWCENHLAVVEFAGDAIVYINSVSEGIQVMGQSFLTAVMKAMKQEEEEQHGS